MVVLLFVVLAFVVFRDSNRADPANPVKPIEYTEDLAYYRSQSTFPLLAPPELPEGWIATSARFDATKPQSWHLGVLTDTRHYVGLEQGKDQLETMVNRHVDEEATEGDPVEVAGASWRTFTDEDGDNALARRSAGVTTLVVGTVSQEELEAYVASLR